jgi:hypothetical protein
MSLRSLSILILCFGTLVGSAFAQARKTVPPTTQGKPIPPGSIKYLGPDHHSLANFKAQNHLSNGTNYLIKSGALKDPTFQNGTALNTVPYFQSWFVTGTRNSIYPYSMVGQSPTAGGATVLNNQIIPLVTVLQVGGVTIYVFDPTVANDPEGAETVPSIGPGIDTGLVALSPLYDATTTYPGPPADSGQEVDTAFRASFNGVRASNWHTLLGSPYSSGIAWVQELEYNNGDWACVFGSVPTSTTLCNAVNSKDFPVVNINTISNNFASILADEDPPNNSIPIIITDFVTAFTNPSNIGASCCVLGYHNAQPGLNPSGPNSVLVWAWGTYLPHSNNPFAPFGNDVMVLSHEIAELYHDPFVQTTGTSVAPWVDGSATFAQANLEVGDAIEAMNAVDVVYEVPLMPNGTPFTYSVQNVALLPWFTRNPLGPVSGPGPGIYSWPNINTLNNGHNPATCLTPGPNGGCYVYGEGSAGFYFGPPY